MAREEVVSGQWSVVSSPGRKAGVRRAGDVSPPITSRAERLSPIVRQRPLRPAPARDRRGVLILVVLSLLILFVVIAVMFVIVATRARAVSKSYAEVNRTGDTPQEVVHGIALDLIRGTLNPHSPFRTTSLLEDMYGHQSVRGMVTGVTPSITDPPEARGAGGLVDIVAIQPQGSPPSPPGVLTPRNPWLFSPVKDAYSGCVLTFISGSARGISTRILGYELLDPGDPDENRPRIAKFRVMVISSEDGRDQSSPIVIDPTNPPWCVINGRPFSGTGVGYNAADGRVTLRDAAGRPYALLPNPAYFYSNTDPAGLGGANEDYDAPDFQNPFLAFYATPNIDLTIQNPWRQIKPSFHDPALIGYWKRQPGAFSDPALVRQVIFRPSPHTNPPEHPVFNSTTNPRLSSALAGQISDVSLGPWDVDNDGDGLEDSIWVDPGYPAQMTKDGRLYKPLAAVLILDLDGRLNVNAHGSLQEIGNQSFNRTTSTGSVLAGPAGAQFPNPPRGSGYGPAEVRLSTVLPQSGMSVMKARYGQDEAPGIATTPDPFSAVRLFSVPGGWPPVGAAAVFAFGSPPDLKGRMAFALDPHGQPVWDKLPAPLPPMQPWISAWGNERIDHPYEIDLSRYSARALPNALWPNAAQNNGPHDRPFSIGELERLLRPNDIDSSTLPSRLVQAIAPDLAAALYRRNELTTDSWDLPVPGVVAPPGMRDDLPEGRAASVAELLHARLFKGGLQADQIPNRISALLSPEVRRGLRMDINRPIGDGLDNGGASGVVDDPAETADMVNYQIVTERPEDQSVPFDRSVGNRQLLARQLYVLMMLCTDESFRFPLSIIPAAPPLQAPAWGNPVAEPLNDENQSELKAKKLAQWAINVVDFRDPDNIMTQFAFDTKPFDADGWSPNAVVWGCEMPVAIITETLAFHDRRVKDSAHDDNPDGGKTRNQGDASLDQPLIPRGSAFVEIMAIFDPNVRVQSADLFFYDSAKRKWLLDLGKTVGNTPVWRLAVTDFHPRDPNLDSPIPAVAERARSVDQGRLSVSKVVSEHPDTVSLQPFVAQESLAANVTPWNFSLLSMPTDSHDVTIERVVWFTTMPPTGADADRTFHAITQPPPLEGFQYSVVGPGGTGAGARTNQTVQGIMVGWRNDNVAANTQQIRLGTPVTFNGTTNDTTPNIKLAAPAGPIGIPVASPPGRIKNSPAELDDDGNPIPEPQWNANDRIGFSISEPLFSEIDQQVPPRAKYYPKPDVVYRVDDPNDPNDPILGTDLEEAYGDLREQDTAADKKFLDTPLDSKAGMPLKDRDMLKTGTYTNVRTVFLQRLADPTRAHDPQSNPYITVDWMPFDLTVFNGQDDSEDPDDTAPDSDPKVRFTTRERGKFSTAQSTQTDYNIWMTVSEDPIDTEPTMDAEFYFRHPLMHSLGHLNKSYGGPTAPGGTAQDNPYLGSPARPFPWIRWANRPFISPLELMEVPASTPARLCLEFNYIHQATTSPYAPPLPSPGNPRSPSPENPQIRPFNHLLNFFRPTPTNQNDAPLAGDFYRLFDFVHVPSPFVGTETMLDPKVFNANVAAPGTETFRAPFNWVSNYRDPGKVNLNTINSGQVWQALTGAQPGQPGISFGEFWLSRRGGGLPVTGQPPPIATTPVAGLPTIMANPYRSGAGGDMVPDLSGVKQLRREGVKLTLLRPSPAEDSDNDGIPNHQDPDDDNDGRMDGQDPDDDNDGIPDALDEDQGPPLFANPTTGAQPDYANPHRNAAFRYRELERLANLTTTRSNVYAIWITVGYFEVFPNPPSANSPGGVDPGHPDGFQLGAELGSDTGEVKRHRGFYILDRSIPVGFERGFNHNVDRAIVLKRFIE